MLSPSRCVLKSMEAQAQRIHFHFHRGDSLTGASSLTPSLCVFVRKLLYLNMRPLGLQALHIGQNLLLVAGQSHSHLSQFTDTDVKD